MRRVLLALALLTGTAHARSEKLLAYERDPAWATSVRFLRVDAKLKVVEKDAEAGYVIFEFTEDKKTFRGSLELFEVTHDGRKQVRFIVTIEDRPQWVEIELLTKLERKLRAELGSPAPAPTPHEPPPKKDEPKKDTPKDEPKGDDKPNDGPPISDKP
ncbi:MAG TPA: hypothetical protein VL326_25520 [Kofleriaceae bacterium]|nr:hypothetical protein [Kofleriaceae bacterium]